jgi:CubicO group peptidase (beta-lactamase class C family)
MELNTTMMIYSMTKTVTAAALLQLVDQGRVGLDDPAITYIEDLPYGPELKIRHLLAQTSGIPNPIPLKWVHLSSDHPNYDEPSALHKILLENPELDFQPGKKYRYSNISYWLLGCIIARVAGIPFEDYVRQNIFRRLNLPETEINFVIPVSANQAKGYLPKWSFLNLFKSFMIDSKFIGEYEDGWLHINEHYLNGPAFGGIVASARAIALFLQDQLQDSSRLFSRQIKTLFFEQQKNNDDQPVEMTLGWHIGRLAENRYYFKEGGGGGFHCEMRLYPAPKIATVVIANNTSFDSGKFLNDLDQKFLGPE